MERPKLTIVEDSEVWAEVDTSGIYLDGKCRPIFIGCEADEFTAMEITVDDAKRLLAFLTSAIFYLEAPKPTLVPS